MQETLRAIVLGIVQGASEFLPISSSGHLYLVPRLLGWHGEVESLSFDVALHVGTTAAVVAYFWRDWLRMAAAFLRSAPQGPGAVWRDDRARLLVLIAFGSVPAAVLGASFTGFFEGDARNIWAVASMLIVFAVVLYVSDRLARQGRGFAAVGAADAVAIGLAQAVSLVPGVSRSGITISAGLIRGFDRASATRFSFLLSTPAIVGATLLKSKDILDSSQADGSEAVFIAGMLTAAVTGFLAIEALLRFVRVRNFDVFVAYRFVAGGGVLVAAAFGA